MQHAIESYELKGGGNLYRATIASGVQHYLQQCSGFFLKAEEGSLANESSPLRVEAGPGVAASAKTYMELESCLFSSDKVTAVALR